MIGRRVRRWKTSGQMSGNIAVNNNLNAFTFGSPAAGTTGRLPNNPGIPYYIAGEFVIPENTTLIIAPGTVIKMRQNSLNYYTRMIVRGTLIADGTPEEKIVFTSIYDDANGGDTNNDGNTTGPGPSQWGTINVENGATVNFDNVAVMYGGDADGYNNSGALMFINNSNATYYKFKIFQYVGFYHTTGSGVKIQQALNRTNIINNEFSDCYKLFHFLVHMH